MSLETVVTARVSNQRLVHLTNADLQAQSTVNTTVLGLACDDAEGEFEVHVGVAFDETDARHIGPAVDLVILILKERGSAAVDTLGDERERIVQRLKDLALVTGRNRIMPETAADTSETFSESTFEHTLLDPQGSGEDEED